MLSSLALQKCSKQSNLKDVLLVFSAYLMLQSSFPHSLWTMLCIDALGFVFLGHFYSSRIHSHFTRSFDVGIGEVTVFMCCCRESCKQCCQYVQEQKSKQSLSNPFSMSRELQPFTLPFDWRIERACSHSECFSSMFPSKYWSSYLSSRGINYK